ncbi:hypothetical protein ACQPZF_25505 [Actinosynnema sp. CS-041913]|uniref:hypothetical protein n=1 Tax=Actinosynnema sp. CS-041913 TaxID=3239917 RepID=UPI003D8B7AE1
MTTRVLYVPDNRELDLSRLSGSDYQTVASLRGRIGRGDRVLLCLEPAVPGHDEMFVRRHDGRVPSVGCNHIPWDNLPPRGSAVATGLRWVDVAKCTVHNFATCPDNRRHCGGDHPKLRPWAGLTLDHVAALVPAGRAVPLMTTGSTVYLVPPNDLRLYESLTGSPARYTPGMPSDDDRASSEPTDCHNASHVAESSVECEGCRGRLLWRRPGRTLCERCNPIMHLPTSPYPL